MQPGFDADEDMSAIGRAVTLAPWEEEHRMSIEADGPPVENGCRG